MPGRPRSRVGLLPSLLLLEGARAGLPGRSPAHAAEPSRLVALNGPSCPYVDILFWPLWNIPWRRLGR